MHWTRFLRSTSRAWATSTKVPLWRLTHWRNPVPHLPPALLGFTHPPTEVFNTEDSANFTPCVGPEDPQCSNQFCATLHIQDHLAYLWAQAQEGSWLQLMQLARLAIPCF